MILIDRVKLDEQVGNTVESFLRRNGIHEVFRAESMSHLAALMDNSTTSSSETTTKQPHQRVIITTIHKMGLLVKDEVMLTRMLHRNSQSTDASATSQFSRIAIITDEAHRSHTASTRETIQKVMKAGDSSENAHISVRLLFAHLPDLLVHSIPCSSLSPVSLSGSQPRQMQRHCTCSGPDRTMASCDLSTATRSPKPHWTAASWMC